MTWKVLPIDHEGSEVTWGGDDLNKLNRYHAGQDLVADNPTDEVNINTKTTFFTDKIRIKSTVTGFSYILRASDLSADRILTLPNMGTDGTLALAAAGAANDWGNFMQTFRSSFFKIMNPLNTFGFTFVAGALAANRNLTIPAITANDELVTLNHPQTLTNKTFTSPIFSAVTLSVDTNTINAGTNAIGDLLVNNGTKFARFPRGLADQLLIMNATGTALIWIDKATLLAEAGGGGGGGSGEGDPTLVNDIITSKWLGTSVLGGTGMFNNFLTDLTNNTPSITNISDSSGRMGMRFELNSDDERAGFKTNNAFLTRMNEPDLTVRYKYDPMSASHNGTDDYRIHIGFVSNVDADFGAGDGGDSSSGMYANSGICWAKQTGDSTIGLHTNNGTTTFTKTTTSPAGLSKTSSAIQKVRIFADDANARWGLQVNDGTITYYNIADLPAQTTRLGLVCWFEAEGSGTRAFELYGVTLKAKVL